jgi:hypothetical protein
LERFFDAFLLITSQSRIISLAILHYVIRTELVFLLVYCFSFLFFLFVQEWGDPRKIEYYYYMKSYSPVDNVSTGI